MAILKAPDTTAGSNDLLRSERIAGGILPKVLNSFDMVVIVVAIILWIPNAAVMTGAGAAAFIYWGLGFITFLIPGAIVTGQLGLMFPGEGSIYVWTTKAFGRFTGFIAGFCAWWSGILVMITAGVVIVSLIQHLGTLLGMRLLGDDGSAIQGFVIIITLVLSCILSTLRFRVTQNLVNTLFLAYGCTILLIGLAGILWLASGHAASTNLSSQSGNWSLNSSNFTFYGTVILALLGIEVPLNMGVEIKDTRSITRYLIWGSVVVMIAYLITTFAVMMAVPLKDQGSPAGITEAVQMGFGSAGTVLSAIVDVLLIGFFVFVSTVYNYSFARLLFVSGLDRRLPAIISKVSGKRVPWVAVLTQTIIGISFTAIIFVLAPLSFKSAELSTVMYDILLASATVVWCVSMIILFVDVIIIRRHYHELFQRIRLAPDWVFYLCSITGTIASGAAIAVIFTSTWTNSSQQTPLTTAQWDAWITGIAVASLCVAVAGFYIGQHTFKSDLKDEDIIAEVTN
jgi:glutamate:GABA antiporter